MEKPASQMRPSKVIDSQDMAHLQDRMQCLADPSSESMQRTTFRNDESLSSNPYTSAEHTKEGMSFSSGWLTYQGKQKEETKGTHTNAQSIPVSGTKPGITSSQQA